MPMLFSIIIPTYKRADKLTRAVDSVLNQSYINFEIIIVNDSPNDLSYKNFEDNINDSRIIYLKNEINSGVNFSRNHAIDKLSEKSDWVIFLDDDDWFSEGTLQNFSELIKNHPNEKWFLTNRATNDGALLTKSPKNDSHFNYALDYLITKRFKGDATHCISKKTINDIRFSKKIKQGEEWLFFYQVGLKTKMYYHSHNSTITDGYGELNFRKRTKEEQLKTFSEIVKEGINLKIIHHPTFTAYIFMRILRLAI